VSLAISYWHNRQSAITGRKPVLTFAYDDKTGWVLQNIGNGPALNVIVAQKEIGGQWFNPVRAPPVSMGGLRTAAQGGGYPLWGLSTIKRYVKRRRAGEDLQLQPSTGRKRRILATSEEKRALWEQLEITTRQRSSATASCGSKSGVL
jgi:hypothetical protein